MELVLRLSVLFLTGCKWHMLGAWEYVWLVGQQPQPPGRRSAMDDLATEMISA
jgi:hypothetical protein